MTAGPLLFARYAYPPNALGLCGADETRTLLEYGDAHVSDGGLSELARTFHGAWPYLSLIAHANQFGCDSQPLAFSPNRTLHQVTDAQLVSDRGERFGAVLKEHRGLAADDADPCRKEGHP